MPATATPCDPAMPDITDAVFLADEAATEAAARALAPLLGPGDTILLRGPIGAGKTHFARALIQTLQALHRPPEDVPSPTFTLVQTYQAGETEIWHADLYRLSGIGDILELGLEEAFATAICLVEWPERLGVLEPPEALHLHFSPGPGGEGRRLGVSGNWPRLDAYRRALAEPPA